MPDAIFDDPRLAAVYDALESDRSDLDAYIAIVAELGAHHILDLGCGTGTLALRLAAAGHDVTGVDPAAASIDVARGKPGASGVRWLCGDATSLPEGVIDLVTMTGNAAQAVLDWSSTLAGVHAALRPGGCFVFETRDPAREGWREWTRPQTLVSVEVAGVGPVSRWFELTDVSLPLVRFRGTFLFPGGEQRTSDSTLRFRDRAEVEADLTAHGYVVDDVRDAPDRPGRELVFLARRP